MRSNRIEMLQEYIDAHKNVSREQLCKAFNLSQSTLRRDIEELVRRGLIRKSYGGVSAQPVRRELTSFEVRSITNAEAKKAIGEKAATLVEDGDVIFIDSGSTTVFIVDALRDRKNVTILTNNIHVINRAILLDDISIITLSGSFNRKTNAFSGEASARILGDYNICKSFMATTGFSLSNGVTNSTGSENELKRTAVSRSQQVVLLADHSKVGVISMFTYCQLDQISTLVTDQPLPPDYARTLRESGGTLLRADLPHNPA